MISLSLILSAIVATTERVNTQQGPDIETVAQVARSLEPEVNCPISVSENLSRVLVLVNRHGASAEVTLKALASALHGSLVQSNAAIQLVRTSQDESSFLNTRTRERQLWLQTRLAEVNEYRDRFTNPGSISEEVFNSVHDIAKTLFLATKGVQGRLARNHGTDLLPAQGLLDELIRRIGIGTIAALPDDVPQVWEDNPTLGAKVLPLHQDCSRQYQAAILRLHQIPIPPTVRGELQQARAAELFSDWDSGHLHGSRLRVCVTPRQAEIDVSLEGFDESGTKVLSSSFYAFPKGVPSPPFMLAKPFLASGIGNWKSLAKRGVEVLRTNPYDLFPHRPDWFFKPQSTEPLNLFVRDALNELAEEDPRKCVVILAPDELWDDVSNSLAGNRVNLDALEAVMLEWSRFEKITREDTIVWRQKSRLPESKDLNNRLALTHLVQSIRRSGQMDLQTLAKFHEELGARTTPITDYWENFIRRSLIIPCVNSGAPHSFLRALGALPDSAWQDLRRVPSEAIARLALQPWIESHLRTESLPVQGDGRIPDIYKHATELFQNGEDSNSARLSVTIQTKPLIGNRNRKGRRLILDGDRTHPRIDHQISWSGFMLHPEKGGIGEDRFMTRNEYEALLDRMGVEIQSGEQTKIVVTLLLPGGFYQRAEFRNPVRPTSDVFPYALAPQALKDTYWGYALAGMDIVRKQMAAGQGSGDQAVRPGSLPR